MATRSLKRFPFYPFWCQHVHNRSHQIPKQEFSSLSWRAELEFRTSFSVQLKVEFELIFIPGGKLESLGKKDPWSWNVHLLVTYPNHDAECGIWWNARIALHPCPKSATHIEEPEVCYASNKSYIQDSGHHQCLLISEWRRVRTCTGGRKRGNRKCSPPVPPPIYLSHSH